MRRYLRDVWNCKAGGILFPLGAFIYFAVVFVLAALDACKH